MGLSAPVTWQQAEDALMEAFTCLRALPDAERAFLGAGSRSCWPAIVRDRQSDYADAEARPSPQLTRRMIDRLDAVLMGERAAALAVPEGHRDLVGRVLAMKLWPGPEGFGWDVLWRAEERRLQRRPEVTSDALRKRYERAVGKVAVRMSALGLGGAG